jgi:protocatechuate 3,4-dioxygenase beta subunit
MHRLTRRVVAALALAAIAGGVLSAQGGGRGQGPGRGGGLGPGRGGFSAPRDGAEQTAVGTASISGRVVTRDTGAVVRRARVTLSAAELGGARSAITDDNGHFSFVLLPAGRYTLNASKPGYVGVAYGATRPGRQGTALQLADGQRAERIDIALPRGSVLTGMVLDEHGEAATNVPVRALRSTFASGLRSWQVAGQATTDDRGIYRIFQLQPGDYIVSAAPRNLNPADSMREIVIADATNAGTAGVMTAPAIMSFVGDAFDPAQLQAQLVALERQGATAYAPVYYPGSASADGAQTISLDPGQERSGIDFRLMLVPTTRISGLVTTTTGASPGGVQVALVPARSSAVGGIFGTNMARADERGRFTFSNVTPGDYVLQARSGGGFGGRGRGGPNSGGEMLWASAEVVVGGQAIPDIVLTLQPGMTVSGRVAYEGSNSAQFDPSNARVSLQPRDPGVLQMGPPPTAIADANGRFVLTDVLPGVYVLASAAGGGRGGPAMNNQASLPRTLKSAVSGGRDVLDLGLEVAPGRGVSDLVVTYTDERQELSGTLQTASGSPTSGFTIIVFPSNKALWQPRSRRIAAARPGTDGRFTFGGLPSGDYRMTAVTDVEQGEWYDPAFLEQLAAASIPISLSDGESKVQDIRLAGN